MRTVHTIHKSTAACVQKVELTVAEDQIAYRPLQFEFEAVETHCQCAGINVSSGSYAADTAFEAAAEAAFNQSGTPLNPIFDPYANDVFFLHGDSFFFQESCFVSHLGMLCIGFVLLYLNSCCIVRSMPAI